jgi:polyisoprenyl-phosphate glycosyltransferase
MSSTPLLSVVVPLYDEAESVAELHRRLACVLEGLDVRAELIFVDDGSTDGTRPLVEALVATDPRVRLIALARNFGHQAAITAGLEFAEGSAVVIMDGDLQHPPELIPELVRRWREGYEVVYAVRESRRGEPWLKRITAHGFYRLLGSMSDTAIPAYAGDFRLVDRRALDAFLAMPEQNRYLRGMFSWIGFRQVGIPCPPAERFGGMSKYTLRNMTGLAVDGLVSFSSAPMRLALQLGLAVSSLAFAGGVAAVVVKIAGVYAVPGWASIVVAVAFLGGAQLLILGVIGAYVGRIYDEVKRRPLYIVRDSRGFDRALDESHSRNIDEVE